MGSSETPQPYRVPAPPDGAKVAWPDDFGTRFAIFVDTEESFDWRKPLDRTSHHNRAISALPDAHARFAARGVPVTYLIDYPVATDPWSIAALKEILGDGRSAIGTQLHPWVNPPFDETLSVPNSFAGNLDAKTERAKLVTLTDAIEAAFGARPRVYRAGRYGIGPRTLGFLAELGYVCDTSMRSGYDYSPEGGPDFRAVGNQAFRTGPDGALFELPLTTVYTGALRRAGATLYHGLAHVPRGIGAASRLGLIERVALTPEDMPIDTALEAIRIAHGEGIRVLNFAYHSPSVAPGNTPYVKNEADLAAFFDWWEQAFELLDRLGIRPASLDELLTAADAAR